MEFESFAAARRTVTLSDLTKPSSKLTMSNEHVSKAVEVYTRQHDFYAEQTAISMQFPIKLVLTLNASVIAASLLLVRSGLGGDDDIAPLVAGIQRAFWAFGAGVVFVLLASFFQWRRYSWIMHRKRNLLAEALRGKNWEEAFEPFCSEPKPGQETYMQRYCLASVAISFLCFLVGAFLISNAM